MLVTQWAEIICNHAMVQIDDERLTEQLGYSPALFFRRMSEYVVNAIPMLNRPPELQKRLLSDMVAPSYADAMWTSDDASLSSETVVQTGATDFDICSVCVRTVGRGGVVSLESYPGAEYDSTTGAVTFPVQTEAGVQYQIDFYSDGSFFDLTPTIKRLFGLAIAVVWDERFARNWLNNQMKIKDSSFETVNESNYMATTESRMIQNRQALNDELRKYEQDIAYLRAVPGETVSFI